MPEPSAPMPDLGRVFLRREGVLAQEAQGQTVLLRPEDGSYYALEAVGARVWELCDGERSLGDVVDVLCAEFSADRQTIVDDVLPFASELIAEHLLVEAS